MVFILYLFFYCQVLSEINIKSNNIRKVSDCERYIKYYLKNNNYYIQEKCYIDNLNPNSKCYENNKIDIIEV